MRLAHHKPHDVILHCERVRTAIFAVAMRKIRAQDSRITGKGSAYRRRWLRDRSRSRQQEECNAQPISIQPTVGTAPIDLP